MRDAGEAVSKDMAKRSPRKSAPSPYTLAGSFGVWYSKKMARRYGVKMFRVGLKTNYFYKTLAKGNRKRGSKASHPGWNLPGDDKQAAGNLVRLTKQIFDAKIQQVGKLKARRRG